MADWSSLELRHLEALVSVARERSVSRAADQLGYTQSAVSQQIRALERIVGEPLLVRSPGARRVELTKAGRVLLAHAYAIRDGAASARRALEELAGVVRVGSVPSAASVLLAPAAASLRDSAPQLVLHIEESYEAAELVEQLCAGAFDLVLAPIVGEVPAATIERLVDDPYVLLVPAGDPLGRLERPLCVADLRGRQIVAKSCDTPSQRAREAALARLEIDSPTVIRANDARTIGELVGHGVGLAVLPRMMVLTGEAKLELVSLAHLVPPREIGVFRREATDRPPLAHVVDALRAVVSSGSGGQAPAEG